MNAFETQGDGAIAAALVDAEGRLVSADPVVDRLNTRAGGAIGRALAVPQLATVARLARRLGIVVSRAVIVADDEVDLDLWVRAQLDGDAVRLAIGRWRELTPWRPARAPEEQPDFLGADADWRWETDAALRLTFLSLTAGQRHGFDAYALLGQPLTALFALDPERDGGLPILGALARHRPFARQAARLRVSDQRVTLAATVRRDSVGAFAGYIGVAHLAEPTPVPAPMAEPAPPLSPTFTTGLDKALRTPLARIVANADSIHAQADGPVRQDYADYAADIANAGRHLLGLVDDLVDLQAIERADFRLPPEPIDLADVARRAAGLLAVRAANGGVRIVRLLSESRVAAQGDFRRALQILVNLVGNAVRYSPRGGEVTVATSVVDGIARAIVADRGKGIAAEDQARIFEKFERVDPSEAGGNGLGLYIARRLARAMGGDLTVESAPGQGARFVLTLPAG